MAGVRSSISVYHLTFSTNARTFAVLSSCVSISLRSIKKGRPAGFCCRHRPAQKARRLRPQGREPGDLLRRSGQVCCRRRGVPQRPCLRHRKARRGPAGVCPRHQRWRGTVLRDQTKGRAGIFRLCLLCQFCFCTISPLRATASPRRTSPAPACPKMSPIAPTSGLAGIISRL